MVLAHCLENITNSRFFRNYNDETVLIIYSNLHLLVVILDTAKSCHIRKCVLMVHAH